MSSERERELTVHSVVPLLVLACRFGETTLVCVCDLLGSIGPSIAQASGQYQVVAGITTVSNVQGPLLLSHKPQVAISYIQ